MSRTILANARVVLPDEVIVGSVAFEGPHIVAIDHGAGVPLDAVDCEGDFVAPGLIELHTDNLERHLQPRPGVKWPLAAAIIAHDAEFSGVGVTTIFDAVRVGSVVSEDRARYEKYARPVVHEILKLRAAGHLRISHFLHLRAEICSETLMEELGEFGPEDRIGIVSLMDDTPGQRQLRDREKWAALLRGRYGLTDDFLGGYHDRLLALSERVRDPHRRFAVEAGRRLGATLASHDDTTEADVAASVDTGCRIAEFPTTKEAAEASRAAGMAVIMGAPNLLRGGSHSGNVSAGELAEAGALDILSSDYAPSSLLGAAVALAVKAGDMPAGIRTVTSAPAAAAGLGDRGAITVGKLADLIRFRLVGDLPVLNAVWSHGRRV